MTSTRPVRRPIRVPARDRATPTPLALAARSAPTVIGLHIDTAGDLHEVRVPSRATAWALAAHLGAAGGASAIEVHRLDQDLVMWVSEDLGAGPRNPAVCVAAAALGGPATVRGAVVFTGWTGPRAGSAGVVADVSVAAVILLASIARSCDLTDRTAARAAEFARLDIAVVTPPTPRGAGVQLGGSTGTGELGSYDALAHTITRPGDLPRCAECLEYGSHEEHQPETLAAASAGAR